MSSDDIPVSKQSSKKKTSESDINEQLLRSLKSRAGQGTTNWMADLAQTALDESPEAASADHEEKAAPREVHDMVSVVDKIFDHFTEYIYDFNRSVAGTDLSVNCDRPMMVREGDQRFGSRGGAAFQGRLSMRQWSLVVRGEADQIHGVMIPSEELFAFNADPEDQRFARFLYIDAVDRSGAPGWNIGGQPVGFDQLRTLAKQLLARLVKVVKGELAPDETFEWTGSLQSDSGKFTRTAAGMKTYRSIAIEQESMPPRPKSFDEDTGFPSYAKSEGSEFHPLHSSSDSGLLSPPAAEVAPAAGPASSGPGKAKTDRAAAAEKAASAPDTVPDAFSLFYRAIDREIEKLAKQGAEAFAAQDLAGAERTLKLTAKVKSFREKVDALREEWDREMADS